MDAINPFISLFSNGVYSGYLWKAPLNIDVGSAAGSGLPVTLAPDGIPRVYIGANGHSYFTGNIGITTPTPNAAADIGTAATPDR